MGQKDSFFVNTNPPQKQIFFFFPVCDLSEVCFLFAFCGYDLRHVPAIPATIPASTNFTELGLTLGCAFTGCFAWWCASHTDTAGRLAKLGRSLFPAFLCLQFSELAKLVVYNRTLKKILFSRGVGISEKTVLLSCCNGWLM